MGALNCYSKPDEKQFEVIGVSSANYYQAVRSTKITNINNNNLSSKNNGNFDSNIKSEKYNEFLNTTSEINIEKDIKSFHILRNIFSFLSEKQKLYLIIYNKQIQKKLEVDIEDYKNLIGIYKKIERDGKGKEYDISSNIMLFEGEYSNRKRNGKGKEYDSNGKLIFEGEYSNGKRNGRGKEYYYFGKLKFEGEYLNGKKWNGKGYNKKGENDFEIEEGKGKGKEYYDGGELKFEGEYLNGERNGKGKEYIWYDYDSSIN